MAKKDLTGQRFGALTVLRENPVPYISPGGVKARRWVCKCDCGKEVTVLQGALTAKNGTRSCGCSRIGSLQIDMTGQRFGRLTVIRPAKLDPPLPSGQKTAWLCRCDCGKEVVKSRKELMSGSVKSCGCLLREASRERVPYATEPYDGTKICAIRPKRKLNSNNKSGYKGVYWSARYGRWVATIGLRNKGIRLGYFQDLQKAVAARKAAEEKYFTPIIEAYEKEKGDDNMKKVSIDNGATFCEPEEAVQSVSWDTLVNCMEDEAREETHAELAPCSEVEFLRGYLSRAKEDLILG